MRNFSPTEIQKIKYHIADQVETLNSSMIWVDKNLKHEEKTEVLTSIKNAKNTFNKIYNQVEDKPVMAVFGASQVGKSYLIKNLLSTSGKGFDIKNNNQSFDFLKEINPPGVGAESTGIVTRFTLDKNELFGEFPIQVKLLSAKDLIIIILDTYFSDLKRIRQYFDKNEIENRLIGFEKEFTAPKQSSLNEFDVLEIKNYINCHLTRHSLHFETLHSFYFFERIAKIISNIEPSAWVDVFMPLWNNNEFINRTLRTFFQSLEKLHFEERAYIRFNEVLRGQGEILDVKRLKELNDTQKESNIMLPNGTEITIPLSILAALTKELVFSVSEDLIEEKPFLKNSDLLDFPGARSRLTLEYEDINDEMIPEMLLRGKVSYLFNKYSDEFNINNLLFCTNDIKLEVNELPDILENWISKNIGTNIQQRTAALDGSDCPPLFIIYTFFNNQLRLDTTNDINFIEDYRVLDYKWDTRFIRFFKNELVTPTRNWDSNWSSDNYNFNNMYMLRDFKYSTDTFEGYEKEGIETGIKNERSKFLEALKDSFLNFDFVKKHFKDPERQWKQSTEINQNGSSLIIESLNKVSNNYSKVKYYIEKLNQITDEIRLLLDKYAHIEDIEKIRKQSMVKVNDFIFSLSAMQAKDRNAFNKLHGILSTRPEMLFNLLNENVVVDTSNNSINAIDENNILLINHPRLKNASSYEDAINILKEELWLNSKEEVEEFLKSRGIDGNKLFKSDVSVTKSRFYVSLIFNFWKEKISDRNEFNYFTNNGMPMNSLSFLTDHLTTIIESRKIDEYIVKVAEEAISETESNHGIEEFLAETANMVINDIVTNFDLNYIGVDTIKELQALPNFHTFRNLADFNKKPSGNIEAVFEESIMSDPNSIIAEKYTAWFEFFRISLLVNSGFVSYDPVANSELLSLLGKYKMLNEHIH